jgi:predicted nuclease of predicted toxin-antitoxin system
MNLLIDAQLPRRLARFLRSRGHDVVHTRDLPNGNRTGDREINTVSMQEQRVVITKDADFVNSFTLRAIPYKLLLVSTGNITNDALLDIFTKNIDVIETDFITYSHIEINRSTYIIHR